MQSITEFLVNNHVKGVNSNVEENIETDIKKIHPGSFVKAQSKVNKQWIFLGRVKEPIKTGIKFDYYIDMEYFDTDKFNQKIVIERSMTSDTLLPLSDEDVSILTACEKCGELQAAVKKEFTDDTEEFYVKKIGNKYTVDVVKL